jgi:hypothetical protein
MLMAVRGSGTVRRLPERGLAAPATVLVLTATARPDAVLRR